MVTGTENTLAALIKTEFDARITISLGSPPTTPNAIIELAEAFAFSVIPHFVSTADITPGTFTAGPDPVVGIGGLL